MVVVVGEPTTLLKIQFTFMKIIVGSRACYNKVWTLYPPSPRPCISRHTGYFFPRGAAPSPAAGLRGCLGKMAGQPSRSP